MPIDSVRTIRMAGLGFVAFLAALIGTTFLVDEDGNVLVTPYNRRFTVFLDDTKLKGTTDDPTDVDFLDDGTLLNNLLVVDVDGDGVNDILATFDRRVEGGLYDDTIIWFKNTLFDEETAP